MFKDEKMMNLELLANEVLLDLFQFLDVVNLFRAFYGLNNRFDQLIFTKLQRYRLKCRELPLLTHLSIVINTNKYPVEKTRDFINNVWRLPKLTHFYIDIIYTHPIRFVEMSVISQSIRCLFTKNICYSSSDLSHLVCPM